jgi:hypothetical protein
MNKGKLVVTSVLLVTVVAILFTTIHSLNQNSLQVQFGAAYKTPSAAVSYAQTTLKAITGLNATVVGTIHVITLSPACSQSNPPCAAPNLVLYYLTSNAHTYRLILLTAIPLTPYNGKQVIVNGLVVVPSQLALNQYTAPPSLYFDGDMYVRSVIYYLPPQ